MWTRLVGERIRFEPISMDMLNDLHAYASDEDVSRFIGWPLMKTIDDSKAYIEKLLQNEAAGSHEYASIMFEDKHIGTMMLFNFDRSAHNVEIGYVLSKDYWSMGIGTEAVKLVIDHIKDDYHKISARVVSANMGSAKVLEKAGFIKEGHQVDQYYIENKYYDCLWYGIFLNR